MPHKRKIKKGEKRALWLCSLLDVLFPSFVTLAQKFLYVHIQYQIKGIQVIQYIIVEYHSFLLSISVICPYFVFSSAKKRENLGIMMLKRGPALALERI